MQPADVRSRQDLVTYLETLIEQARRAKDDDHEANVTTEDFIEAASGWLRDTQLDNRGLGPPVPTEPTWSLIATIFAAALVYE